MGGRSIIIGRWRRWGLRGRREAGEEADGPGLVGAGGGGEEEGAGLEGGF